MTAYGRRLALRPFFLYGSTMKQPTIFVIVGPTASGKTALSIELAKKFDGEVISADSRQVYKGLDIGTGKVTKKEMAGIPHHLLDVVSPKKVFNANDFVLAGHEAIEDILKRGKVPIICGGTGFYIDALFGRVTLPNIPPNPRLRERLAKKSATELFALLKLKDPRRAKNIDRHNPVRLIRALEIVAKLGKVPALPKSRAVPLHNSNTFTPHDRGSQTYQLIWIGIKPDDATLRAKIQTRLLQRMKAGMVKEARTLHARGLSYKRMDQLGLEYRYLALFLQKKLTKKEMLEQLEHKIWDYAQRQMRYWKRNREIQWFVPPLHPELILKQIR